MGAGTSGLGLEFLSSGRVRRRPSPRMRSRPPRRGPSIPQGRWLAASTQGWPTAGLRADRPRARRNDLARPPPTPVPWRPGRGRRPAALRPTAAPKIAREPPADRPAKAERRHALFQRSRAWREVFYAAKGD